MATITFKGEPAHTVGELPKNNSKAPDFKLVNSDLSEKSLKDYKGQHVILNIFPSVDTGICATSVRNFNKEASELENTKVLCVSKDLPFEFSRFCAAEGLNNIETLSDFKTGQFGKDSGVTMADTPFSELLSRDVVVINKDGNVVYTEQVPEIAQEPNYKAALEAVANL